LEQAVGPGGGVFDSPMFGQVSLYEEKSDGASVAFVVQHDGYAGRNGIGVVDRRVSCLPNKILLQDRVEGHGRHRLEIVFNLAPGLLTTLTAGAVSIDVGKGWTCVLDAPPNFEVRHETGYFSDSYMVNLDTVRVIFSGEVDLPFVATSSIRLGKPC
jgi:hypothetical protein